MKNVDYIIVGLGIAGVAFCEQLQKHKKSFVVIDHNARSSTAVSGGVFNPVVLKRFTKAWNASQHLDVAVPFYENIAKKLKVPFIESTPVLRIFNTVEEQNDWFVASDKNELAAYLSSEVVPNSNPSIKAKHGFGKVIGSGRIFPKQLLETYRSYLKENDQLVSEAFQYELLVSETNYLQYKAISASKIVFCEGASVVKNPFFPTSFLIGNKGEYLIIHAPTLQLEEILKGPLFIIPLGEDRYKVGATYSREDYSHHPTSEAKEQISTKLKKMISCPFKVIDQVAGVRPTTKDRKPLLGALPADSKKIFFNGLGTRGILMAPLLSEILYNYTEMDMRLPSEIDITRLA
ncbi:NAD(P)/FAD-dependent oxidoreductase [Cochleicola gelatinilyticus]|uniref:FAD dependent oxidoreductase domain-containing protein n=1 Tax=Cochleicola gelatinilyticus TaxID=1763537 RepID=A0A167IKX4_9FLAO|nr:FAD-dependent oxidoreductase [Cochleicola gelatinilyticus]OAB79769.1 hypothetical protein ULVI_03215 [Cochleicola gelatinilyticus]